ncbi:MAG: hypothetical protein HC888_19430 [Candidatus Competibacteraceae bacterium]|nr:hypothetical protein [Candidatus Competibacteraceae bacterium]
MEEVHFSPDYWVGSGLPGAPTDAADQTALKNAMLSDPNCIGIHAQWHTVNCSVSGYYCGVLAEGLSGSLYGLVTTNCTIGLLEISAVEMALFNCSFSGNDYGHYRTGGTGANAYGCTFSGGIAAVKSTAGGPFHYMRIDNCVINGQFQIERTTSLYMHGSTFVADTPANIVLGDNVSTVQIFGSPDAHCGPANVQNNSGNPLSSFLIRTNSTVTYPSVAFPFEGNRTHKPDKAELFNVTDPAFAGGARGDGMTDDTAAIAAAGTNDEAGRKGVMKKLAESFGRGLLDYSENIPANIDRRGLLMMRNQASIGGPVEGDASTPEGYLRGLGIRVARAGDPTGTAALSGLLEGEAKAAPSEQAKAGAIEAIDKQIEAIDFAARLRNVAETDIDPISSDWMAMRGLYSAARSMPYTLAAVVPGGAFRQRGDDVGDVLSGAPGAES